MGTSVTFNGTSYTIPASGELNWSALSNFLIDVGQHAALSTSGVRTLRVALTTPVTVAASTDYAIVCKLSSPGAVAVTLPAGVAGQIFVIHDGTGDAASNNITITPNGSETINGAATRVLSHNRGAITLQYSTTGTDWKVTDEFYPSATIVNADIGTSAAIAYSKLALSSSIATGDLASGLLVPATKGGTGLSSGTSGGVPYFDSSTTIASSGALTSAALVKGGGAGAAPTSLALGTANQVLGMNNGATAYEHKTLATDGTGTDVGITHTANTVTVNLPSASATARGLMTTGTQTIAGAKTFSGQMNTSGGIDGADGSAATPAFSFSADPDTGVYRSTTNTLGFATNGAVVGTVDGNSNWVLGLTSSASGSAILTVQGNSNAGSGPSLLYTSNQASTPGASDICWQASFANGGTTTTGQFARFQKGSTTIGSIAQNASTTVAYNTSSDARLKTNVKDLSGSLAVVMQMKPRNFDWLAGGNSDGFIAQEMVSIYPQIVYGSPDDDPEKLPMQLDYGKLTTVLVGALQDLKREFDAYKAAHP